MLMTGHSETNHLADKTAEPLKCGRHRWYFGEQLRTALRAWSPKRKE
jgi:hypothetical protein